jgi:hypothetical protein
MRARMSQRRATGGEDRIMVKPAEKVLATLHCRTCGEQVQPQDDGLACQVCGRRYPLVKVLKKISLVGRTWRILVRFDWYSPWYQSKHTYEEVFRWFESCGLEDLRVIDQPLTVPWRRPLTVDSEKKHPTEGVSQCAG